MIGGGLIGVMAGMARGEAHTTVGTLTCRIEFSVM